jgi:hypothetical protein
MHNTTYDPSTRVLSVEYVLAWVPISGRGTLTLSEDGRRLTGTFRTDDGATGPWVLERI